MNNTEHATDDTTAPPAVKFPESLVRELTACFALAADQLDWCTRLAEAAPEDVRVLAAFLQVSVGAGEATHVYVPPADVDVNFEGDASPAGVRAELMRYGFNNLCDQLETAAALFGPLTAYLARRRELLGDALRAPALLAEDEDEDDAPAGGTRP